MKQDLRVVFSLIHFALKHLVINSVFRIREALMQPGVFLLRPVELFPARHHQVIVKEVRSEIMEQRQKQTQFSSEESCLLSEQHAGLSFGGLLQTPCLSLTTERLLVNCLLFYFICKET